MSKKNSILNVGIIFTCFFYTGSAYMSQMYLLTEYFSDRDNDLITSGAYYALQAAGMLIFMTGLKKYGSIFSKRKTFIIMLFTGMLLMPFMFIANTGIILVLSGCAFNLFVGIYFGYYIAMLSYTQSTTSSGLAYGIAYGLASVGTYLLSLMGEGSFFTSKWVCLVYVTFAVITMVLVYFSEDIPIPENNSTLPENVTKDIKWSILIVFLMSVISTLGSGLYLALPGTQNVNFTLARAFYALGLIIAGIIIDKSRELGGIITLASLTYPLIATSVLQNSGNKTIAVCLSYLFLGFIAVYRIVKFTDHGNHNHSLLAITGIGLMVSRIADVTVTIFLTFVSVSDITKLFTTAVLFAILMVIFILYLTKNKTVPQISPVTENAEARLANFSETHGLTAREQELLKYICEGLSDSEIAERCFISKSTVRFHVSNLLKKTNCSSRLEVSRKFSRS